jgi:hypothetical protein
MLRGGDLHAVQLVSSASCLLIGLCSMVGGIGLLGLLITGHLLHRRRLEHCIENSIGLMLHNLYLWSTQFSIVILVYGTNVFFKGRTSKFQRRKLRNILARTPLFFTIPLPLTSPLSMARTFTHPSFDDKFFLV